ncbi:MAG: hypothetical protein NWE99_11095 [Candidatus Bathyarchaeota archaeon]|nr:hypothetical protein [Candidatus Bathyarchaeota archaeon]
MSKKDSKNGSFGHGFRFINVPLSSAEKDELRSMPFTIEDVLDLVDVLALEGYRIGVSHDSKNRRFIASITDRRPDSTYTNVCITGSGSSAFNALVAVLFRHIYIAQRDWDNFGRDTQGGDFDFG